MELNQSQPSPQNPELDSLTNAPPVQPTAPSAPSQTKIPQDTIFRRIQSYPFHSDPSYQSGLSTILGHSSTPASPTELSSNADLVLQTQLFYFARKYGLEPIDVTEYKNFLALTASFQSQAEVPQRNGDTPPLLKPDPVPRPSAPTPNSAAAAPVPPLQPDSQGVSSPPISDTNNKASAPAAAPPTQDANPPYPTSFADIVDLITQNKPIPGIETIPDTVLEPGSSKQDKTAKRKKPWEKTEESQSSTEPLSAATEGDTTSVGTSRRPEEGVMRILQPDAILESDLLAKD